MAGGTTDSTERWARTADDGRHRLILGRHWADGPLVAFIGLNPSTADATEDDPTTRRCMAFARAWGFGGVLLANLYTFRTPDPRLLQLTKRPLALGADNSLRDVAEAATLIVEAWGAHAMAAARADHVRGVLAGRAPVAVLGLTQAGAPRHPLYAQGSIVPTLVRHGDAGPELLGPAPIPAGPNPPAASDGLFPAPSAPRASRPDTPVR